MKLPPGYVPGVGVTRATAYGGFGEKLLKQYGWKDGEGLGAEGGGIKSALKVLQKDDHIGVGARQVVREKETADWWQQSFDSAALSLRQNDAEASESSDDSDDDAETPSAQRNRDGTLASGTPAELRLARELAKDPWGRFGGRGGKLARIRKQEAAAVAAMQAANGGAVAVAVARDQAEPPKKKRKRADATVRADLPVAPFSQTPAIAPPAEKRPKKSSKSGKSSAKPGKTPTTASGSTSASEPSPSAEELKMAKKAKKKSARLEEAVAGFQDMGQIRGAGAAPAAAPAAPGVPWWGASQFVSSGCLGGLSEQPKQTVRASFTEDTQADLYNRTQAAKTAGKKGLGAGQGKAAGHEWKGSKVVFEDAEDAVPPPTTGVTPGQAPPENGAALPETAAAEDGSIQKVSSKRLRKLTRQILEKAAGRKLKITKLVKQVAGMKPQKYSTEEFQALVIKKVAGCPKLAVEGKYAVLLDRE